MLGYLEVECFEEFSECNEVDECAIYGQVGMLHLSIVGQVRQLAQIAEITHKMSCQSVSIANALPNNELQKQRAITLRRITQELKDVTHEMGLEADLIF